MIPVDRDRVMVLGLEPIDGSQHQGEHGSESITHASSLSPTGLLTLEVNLSVASHCPFMQAINPLFSASSIHRLF